MKTWVQLLLSVPSISSFSFVIATNVKKEVWGDDFGLLGKQPDGPVIRKKFMINNSSLGGKNSRNSSVANKEGEGGKIL